MLKNFEAGFNILRNGTLAESDLQNLSLLNAVEDIELREAEALYASDLRLMNLSDIVPARFRILQTFR